MTSISDKSDDDLLIAEYALGVLPYDERKGLEAKIAESAHLQKELAQWDNNFVSLSTEYKSVIAPLSILQNTEERLFGAEKSASSSWWNSLQFWRSSALAGLAGVVLLAGLFYNNQTTSVDFNADYIAEIKSESEDLRLASAFDAEQNQLKFNRVVGQARANRALEIWLIADGGKPISLGLVPNENSFTITLTAELAAKISSTALLAISDEPEGGSPTGQPTGDVLALGKVTQI